MLKFKTNVKITKVIIQNLIGDLEERQNSGKNGRSHLMAEQLSPKTKEFMETIDLLKLVQQTLEDNKAEEIVSLDVHEMTSVTDWMVICSATSKRHAKALSDHLVTKIKAQGIQPLGVEGENQNEWLLVDLGDVVIHIMLPEIRTFYSLEKLWNVVLKVREDSDN